MTSIDIVNHHFFLGTFGVAKLCSSIVPENRKAASRAHTFFFSERRQHTLSGGREGTCAGDHGFARIGVQARDKSKADCPLSWPTTPKDFPMHLIGYRAHTLVMSINMLGTYVVLIPTRGDYNRWLFRGT